MYLSYLNLILILTVLILTVCLMSVSHNSLLSVFNKYLSTHLLEFKDKVKLFLIGRQSLADGFDSELSLSQVIRMS